MVARGEARLMAAVERIRAEGGEVHAIPGDLGRQEESRIAKQQRRIAGQDQRVLELEKAKAEQSRRIDGLRAENAELKTRLEALERRLPSAALTRAEWTETPAGSFARFSFAGQRR